MIIDGEKEPRAENDGCKNHSDDAPRESRGVK